MKKIFIPTNLSLGEMKTIIEKVEKEEGEENNLVIGSDFDQIAATMKAGDTLMVHSLDIFPSMIGLLSKIAELQDRGISLRSIAEPWLNQEVQTTAEILERMRQLAVKIHTRRTNIGLDKARSKGVRLGRTTNLDPEMQVQKIEMIEQVIREKRLSVAKVCAMFDLPKHTLYNYRRKVVKQSARK